MARYPCLSEGVHCVPLVFYTSRSWMRLKVGENQRRRQRQQFPRLPDFQNYREQVA